MIFGFFNPNSFGNDGENIKYNFSFLYGWRVKFFHKQPDFKIISLLPKVDFYLNKFLDLEFEGNLSYYEISKKREIYLLGLNSNFIFKPISLRRGSLFIIGGAGLGYTNSNRKIVQLGDSHTGGILQLGIGINRIIGRGLGLRGEYRYIHLSDPFRSDSGLNSHNLIFGVSF